MSLFVYLSSAYERRAELQRYRDDLTHAGIGVTSRWLDGPIRAWQRGAYVLDGDFAGTGGDAMTLILELAPCGVYVSRYEREDGELAQLEARAAHRARPDNEHQIQPRITVGGMIREAMEASGITGRELARATGMSEQIVSHWRTNTTKPTNEAIRIIAQVLGIEPSILRNAAGRDPMPVRSTNGGRYLSAAEKARVT